MKKHLLYLLLITTQISFAQNLVINPSFEDTINCPNQIGQTALSDGWSSWSITPDYYHACANSSAPPFGVPVNNRGVQPARSGNAYIGLFTFSTFGANMREFVGRQLLTPLVTGQKYFVSFWAAHADTSYVLHATNNLGIRFSTVAFSQFNPDTVNNLPHVFSAVVITDTVNWTQVSGSFIADSAYTHFGIGNYFEDALTTVTTIGTGSPAYAYYLIDDVCISTDSLACLKTMGVPETSGSNLQLYPNPASDVLHIEGALPENSVIKIFNAKGQLLLHITARRQAAPATPIKVSALENGIYFAVVTSVEKHFVQRFQIAR